MNLITLAVMLEDHVLYNIFGSGKMIHMVNECITDEEHHINVHMTGRELAERYKNLSYEEQHRLNELVIFDEAERSIIVHQIDVLHVTSQPQDNMKQTIHELAIVFIAIVVLIIAATVTIVYYNEMTKRNAQLDSKLFGFITVVVDKLSK